MLLSHGGQLRLLARPVAFKGLTPTCGTLLPKHGGAHGLPTTCQALATCGNGAQLQQCAPPATLPQAKEGIRFQYEPARSRLSFRTWIQRRQQRMPTTTRPEVDVMVEGKPLGGQVAR